MKKTTMSRTPHLGDTQVDEAGLADLCRRSQVRELLERRVDLVSKNGLKPLIRVSILQEAQLLYAA
jgi:predicted nucleotidyltransferase